MIVGAVEFSRRRLEEKEAIPRSDPTADALPFARPPIFGDPNAGAIREPSALDPAEPRRELAIEGFVYSDGDGTPLAGVEILRFELPRAPSDAVVSTDPDPALELGASRDEETTNDAEASPEDDVESGAVPPSPEEPAEFARSDADGTFSFRAAVRPRFSRIAVRGKGLEEWVVERVVTGDGGLTEGGNLAASVASFGLVERPARIRWTIFASPVVAEPAGEFGIEVNGAFVEEWGRGGRLHVRGTSTVPQGFHISCELGFDDLKAGASVEAGVIADGRWLTRVPILESGRPIFSGPYRVTATSHVLLENSDTIDRLDSATAQALRAAGEILTEQTIFVGSRSEHRLEDRAVQAYYRRAVPELKRLELDLKSRIRETEPFARNWHPDYTKAHRELFDAEFQEILIRDDGLLDEEAWRRFLDREWRPRLEEMFEEHQNRTLNKYVAAEQRLSVAIDSLHPAERSLFDDAHVLGVRPSRVDE